MEKNEGKEEKRREYNVGEGMGKREETLTG